MSAVSFRTTGSFKHMERFLYGAKRANIAALLEPYAEQGLTALREATPRDTGLTAQSWSYEIKTSFNYTTITWSNSDIEDGFPVAVMLQYGHGTGTGGYVQGRDYINPALRPIFDKIANGVWKVVASE